MNAPAVRRSAACWIEISVQVPAGAAAAGAAGVGELQAVRKMLKLSKIIRIKDRVDVRIERSKGL
jgi:hypothetical protein